MASKPFGVNLSVGARKLPAALLTRAFISPCLASASATNASTLSTSRTLHATDSARPPAARISATVCSSGSGLRPQTVPLAPSAAKRKAISRPSPVPPPHSVGLVLCWHESSKFKRQATETLRLRPHILAATASHSKRLAAARSIDEYRETFHPRAAHLKRGGGCESGRAKKVTH